LEHYLPNKSFPKAKPSNKAIMSSQFETSIAKMKSSFDAIEAAKTHTIVLDFVPNRKTAGRAGAATKTTTKVVKPVSKTEETAVVKSVVEYTKKPEGIIPEEVIKKTAKKPAAKKSSKLKKLLRGKTIDCSA